MNLTQLLVPTLTNQLAAVQGWLTKAEGWAAERGESPDELLARCLAPDMWPLASQLRVLAFQAQEPVWRLRDVPVPEAVVAIRTAGSNGAEQPGTWTDARAVLADALAFLATVGPNELDGAADRPLAHALPMGMVFDMTGETYVRDWALPQAAFHQLAAYAILRAAGVPLGKPDYVPHMFAYLRPGTMPGA
jgi:hypothetical protein